MKFKSNLQNGETNGKTEKIPTDASSQIIEILTRCLEIQNHEEFIHIDNERIRIKRYDHKIGSLLFPFNCDSYIIVEKHVEILEEKPIGEVYDWQNVQTSSTPRKSDGSITSEFDLTGSPLSCHFLELKSPDIDYSQEGLEANIKHKFVVKTYHGFALVEARKLANHLNSALRNLKLNEFYLPPIWIACDGRDKSGTAFLGLDKNETSSNVLTVTRQHPFIGINSLPALDHINSHFNFGSVLPRVKSKVCASYEIVPEKSGKSSSSVDLHCEWHQTLSILSSPSLDATTSVSLHLELDDESSQARHLYHEFVILHSFIKGFNEKCLKWRKSKQIHKVDQLLQNYFENYGERDRNATNTKGMVPDLDKMVASKFLEMNSNKEFTEEIWNILKVSESLSELSDGFKMVFTNVSRGVIRPRIHVKNETEFAAVCRGLMRGQRDLPSLENWEAINMLIQIGLEKIKKDYISIFQVCDLVNSEQLCFYTNWSTKTKSYSECLKKLEKMHVVLQVIVALKKTLNLPNTVLSHLTSKTLLDLENVEELPKDFEYQLETSLLKTILDNVVPSIWSYETWSVCDENPNFEKKLRFVVKKDEHFFKLEDDNDKEELSATTLADKSSELQKFYCLCIVKTGDIF